MYPPNDLAHPLLIRYGRLQGATIALAALSTVPWLAERVALAILLAPVAGLHHMTSQPVLTMAKLDTDALFTLLGVHQFLPSVQVSCNECLEIIFN